MATIVDSYSESNRSSDYSVSLGLGCAGAGQSFTGDGGTLNSAKFFLKKVNSPTGNAYAKIYAHTNTFGSNGVPTGSALATSDAVDVSGISTTQSLVTFTFSGENKITLDNETNYVVMLEYNVNDPDNWIYVGKDSTSPTHSGNAVGWFNFGSYYYEANSSWDVCFYVYKDDPPNMKYWVGGSGNWSDDTNHWATSSGGSPGTGNLPTSSDDVFIDSNSGFGSGGTITLDANAICHDFTSNSGNSYTVGDIFNLFTYGDISLESGITWSAGQLIFSGSEENRTLHSNECILTGVANDEGDLDLFTGSILLSDDLEMTGEFYLSSGTFDANDHNVTANDFYFYADTGYTPTVIMGSGIWEATGDGNVWYVDEYSGELVTIIPETSTIKLSNDSGDWKGLTIYDDNEEDLGKVYNNLFLTGSAESRIEGDNTFNEIEATPGQLVKFSPNSTTILSSLKFIGETDNLIVLNTQSGIGQFTLSKSSGTVSCDYLDISNSNASGGATWYAGSHSNDTTNNDGWIFEDAPSGTIIKDMIGGFIPFPR